MTQVQCPNCGGYKVSQSEYHYDPTSGQKLKTPNAYFEEDVKKRYPNIEDPLSKIMNLITFSWLFEFAFRFLNNPRVEIERLSNNGSLEDWRNYPRGFDYSCQICGYGWSQKDNEPAPNVMVRPDLIEKGNERLEEEARRRRLSD